MLSSPRSGASPASSVSTGKSRADGGNRRVKDASIICFEHCEHKIFSLNELPSSCPECGDDLTQYSFPNLPPFKLPSPITRAIDHPCSVIIKPTRGDFLHDYESGDNLHIAVTDSRGQVYEFDKAGVTRKERTREWDKCLVVNLNSAADPDMVGDPDWGEYWDWRLQSIADAAADAGFAAKDYDAVEHNCMAFVLAFLASLRQEPFSSMAVNKVEFCRRFVLPKTRVVPKYIGLYRKLLKSERGLLAVGRMEKKAAEAATSSSSSSTISPSRSPGSSEFSGSKCSNSDGKTEIRVCEDGSGHAAAAEREGDESEIEDF